MSFFSIVLWQENEAGSHFGLTWSSQEMADLRWHINWWLLAWVSHTCKCQWVCSSGGSGGIPEYSYEYLFHSNSSKRIGSVWEKQDVLLLFNFSPGHYSITIYYSKKIIVEVICSPNMKCYWNFKTLFKNNCPDPLYCFEHFWCICRPSRLCPMLCQVTEASKWAESDGIGWTLSTVSEKVLNKVIPKGQNHQNSVLPPSMWCREYRHFLLLSRIQAGCTQSEYNSRWQLLEWTPVILKIPLT